MSVSISLFQLIFGNIQVELKHAFPTWESMKQNGEMIKNACILSSKPDVLLDFISEELVTEILQEGLHESQSHMSMLALVMPKEPPQMAAFDPFHNQYVFYVASAEEEEFMESKLYILVSQPGVKPLMYTRDEYTTSIRKKPFGKQQPVSTDRDRKKVYILWEMLDSMKFPNTPDYSSDEDNEHSTIQKMIANEFPEGSDSSDEKIIDPKNFDPLLKAFTK